MGRALDFLMVVLLLGAALAFALGVRALEREEDRFAIYWLAVGGLMLKTSTDLIRPGRAR
ncbi:MAG TPA: hypothetical protein VJT73_18350 [Polyangiaceae bacterium]|nr:hypothetical protein [Polyangiaceae bacterium]